MVAKSRLQAALAREKGTDYDKLLQKKKHKAALQEKKKKSKSDVAEDADEDLDEDQEMADGEEAENENVLDLEAEVSGEDDEDSDEDEDEDEGEESKYAGISLASLAEDDESTSESELDEPEDQEDEEEDIDLEEIEDELEDDEDIVPFQRTTINNTAAINAALKRMALPKDLPFSTTQVVLSEEAPTEAAIPDVSDDTNRELKFLAQSLDAARRARALLRKEGVPFTRPNDYFAEMLKPEEQMEKVKAKLVEEATAKKASAEARKQRDLKKFGKQVQIAKQQERAKQKRETLEKIKTLKRKRADGSSGELGVTEAEDLFDVAVDNEISSGGKAGAGGKKRPGAPHGAPSAKRQRKDSKYGFGGKKRHSKSGDAMSSGDLSGFNARGMKGRGGGAGGAKGKATRPGKARRQAASARR